MDPLAQYKYTLLEQLKAATTYDLATTPSYRTMIMICNALQMNGMPKATAEETVTRIQIQVEEQFFDDVKFITEATGNFALMLNGMYHFAMKSFPTIGVAAYFNILEGVSLHLIAPA